MEGARSGSCASRSRTFFSSTSSAIRSLQPRKNQKRYRKLNRILRDTEAAQEAEAARQFEKAIISLAAKEVK